MANSIMGANFPMGNQMGGGNPMQLMQQFQQFRSQMAGRNPQQMVNQMVQSGQMTPAQRDSLMQQAQSIMGMMRR